jgi:hypothetical protein
MRLLVIGIAVIFGLISTAPNFQGAQFLKLPELIQHYSEHQSGPESFSSFLAFVKEHYFNNDHHGSNEQHMPFKTTGMGCSVALITDRVYQPTIENEIRYLEKRSLHFGEPNGSLNDFNGSVWNPPRLI